MSDTQGASGSVPADRLVAEALTKSGLLWIQVEDRAWPAWHAAVDGTAYVVGGGGEQTLPDLPESVTLVLRSKDSRARLLTVPATARRVRVDDADWGTATAALRTSRLNSSVPQDRLVDHWAESATVVALVPQPDLATVGADGQEGSGAAAPAPSTATTR